MLVLGATGSGRTTLVRALTGIVPQRIGGEWLGSLTVDGTDASQVPVAGLAHSFGVVTPDAIRWPLMTRAADQVALGLENRALHRAELDSGVERGLAAFGLAADDRVGEMSAGTRQRLGLAAAFATRSPLLILDDPTDYLDRQRRADLIAILREQSRTRDQTLILVDRHASDMFELADSVLVLDEGRQVYFGPPAQAGQAAQSSLERAGAWLPSIWKSSLPVPVEQPFDLSAGTLPIHPLLTAHKVAIDVTDPTGQPTRTLFANFSLALSAAEVVAVVGDNGAGATSLIRALSGERKPTRGTILVGDGTEEPDVDPQRTSSARLRRLVGVVSELPLAVPLTTTVAREVGGGSIDPRRDELAWADLAQVLSRFAPHLPAAADPSSLSAGAARLAQLCALLWSAPGVALLDQPEVGLDRRGFELLVKILDEMRSLGQAQLIVSHDERLIARADRVVELAAPKESAR